MPTQGQTMKKPPKLRRFPAAKQRRLDELLDKNSEGTITPTEKATLTQLVAEAEELMVANAKRLAEFAKSEATTRPTDAVPVTVWVQRQPAEP
jgi:hypothetical protein